MELYVILGVEPRASVAEVKRAYRRLARRYHPDINPGDREAAAFYRRLTEAYETLSDPERRRRYDANGLPSAAPEGATQSTVEFHGFDFSAASGSASATFDDLFAEMDADERNAPDVPVHGSDVAGEVSLSFEEAFRGADRRLTVTRLVACPACKGRGVRRSAAARCAHCQGAGSTRWRRGHMVFAKRCEPCGGTGVRRERPCSVCHGDGRVQETDRVSIHVPAGIADKSRMKVTGQGNVGRDGAAPGDLYITAHVAAHPVWTRSGDDLHIEVPIAVHEAALGARISIPTLDGTAELDVPPGTETGRQFRLDALGMPSPRTGRRGDLVVTTKLVLPRLDARTKALLQELGALQRDGARDNLSVS